MTAAPLREETLAQLECIVCPYFAVARRAGNMSFTSFDVSITATMKSMGLEPFLGLQLASIDAALSKGYVSEPDVGYVFFRLSMDNLILLGVFTPDRDVRPANQTAGGIPYRVELRHSVNNLTIMWTDEPKGS